MSAQVQTAPRTAAAPQALRSPLRSEGGASDPLAAGAMADPLRSASPAPIQRAAAKGAGPKKGKKGAKA